MEVIAERLEEMSLLGLFMKAALQERVRALERAGPSGEVAIESGGMTITLSFSRDRVVVRKGLYGRPRARIAGELGALAELARGRLVGPLLRRHIRISGDPSALLPLARVFRGDS